MQKDNWYLDDWKYSELLVLGSQKMFIVENLLAKHMVLFHSWFTYRCRQLSNGRYSMVLAYGFPPLPEKKEGWEEWDKAHYVVNRWMVGCGGDPSLGHSPIWFGILQTLQCGLWTSRPSLRVVMLQTFNPVRLGFLQTQLKQHEDANWIEKQIWEAKYLLLWRMLERLKTGRSARSASAFPLFWKQFLVVATKQKCHLRYLRFYASMQQIRVLIKRDGCMNALKYFVLI